MQIKHKKVICNIKFDSLILSPIIFSDRIATAYARSRIA